MVNKYFPGIVLFCVALAVPMLGAERDFQAVVGAIEAHFGIQHTRIPMLGLAKLLVRASGPSGVHRFELATFEDLTYSSNAMREFRAAVGDVLGPSWQPMVQVHAQGRKEYTGMFLRGQRGRFLVLIATIGSHEATVVEIQLSPGQLLDWLRAPEKMGRRVSGTSGREDRGEEE